MAQESLAVGATLEERGNVHFGRRAISKLFKAGCLMSKRISRWARKM